MDRDAAKPDLERPPIDRRELLGGHGASTVDRLERLPRRG